MDIVPEFAFMKNHGILHGQSKFNTSIQDCQSSSFDTSEALKTGSFGMDLGEENGTTTKKVNFEGAHRTKRGKS